MYQTVCRENFVYCLPGQHTLVLVLSIQYHGVRGLTLSAREISSLARLHAATIVREEIFEPGSTDQAPEIASVDASIVNRNRQSNIAR